jgi:predicted RNase H-like nuclease (RuvC/YqgF family)
LGATLRAKVAEIERKSGQIEKAAEVQARHRKGIADAKSEHAELRRQARSLEEQHAKIDALRAEIARVEAQALEIDSRIAACDAGME